MWKCSKCGEQVEAEFDACWNCGTSQNGREDPSFSKDVITAPKRAPRTWKVLVTTTPSVEGRRIGQYCGVVTGEAILGANVFKDFFASITDIVGGRSGAYEGELRKARDIALGEVEEAAVDLGANAVVGVDIDYETVGNMLMVCISGTAVVLE